MEARHLALLPHGITAGRGTLCSKEPARPQAGDAWTTQGPRAANPRLQTQQHHAGARSSQHQAPDSAAPCRGPGQLTPRSGLGSWPPQCLSPSAKDDAVLCFCLIQEAILSRDIVVSLKTSLLGRGPACNRNAGLHLVQPNTQHPTLATDKAGENRPSP